MKIERIKSYILTTLVIISLLLTFAIWNYKPNNSTIKGEANYLNEIDLGGTEQTKKTIVHPNQIVFHKEKEIFGFEHPADQQSFYRRMQEWVFDDFQTSRSSGIPRAKNYIEVAFPGDMPIEIIKSLFKVNSDEELPNWSFNRMYINFNEIRSTLSVMFISIDNHQQVSFTVSDSNTFENIWSYIQTEEGQSAYFTFGDEDSPIYLPKDKITLPRRLISVNSININLLVSALFSDPWIVNPNSNDGYLSDGQRRIKLLEDRRSMEFIHPMHSQNDKSNVIELLDRSLSKINVHKGWTDTYYLEVVNPKTNLLRYRMKYDGFPVFNKSDLSIIETELINTDLRAYRRPLFNLVNSLDASEVTLLSGKEIAYFLKENDVFKREYIKDIQVGYRLTYSDRVSHTLSLDPAWYMNYNGSWIEIRVDQFEDTITGGN